MAAELGLYFLWLGFAISLALAVIPLIGTIGRYRELVVLDRPLAVLFFVAISASFFFLAWCFVTDDFSVAYVASHSNTLLPWYYKITAVWGSHEGSMLVQIWALSIWMLAFAIFSESIPSIMRARILAVLGMISLAFVAFTVFTSSPFDRILIFSPTEGADLNPLLQDFGMIIHPPLLYIGYVGFGVSFAFAIAALMDGRLDAAWVRWSRPWALGAWMFLTLGITIGSWWAYAELGWGGWWFWDPVENASLMPWLVGTALVHSLAVTEQRGIFKSWTLLLSITAFSLSLLGAFLVRSGVVTSVHAFASDPARGLFILMILGVAVGGSLAMYALRAPKSLDRIKYSLLSREFMLLMNNILLMVVTFIVFLGTLWPLAADAFDLGKVSVGPAYFNALVIPIFTIICLLMPLAPFTRWKDTASKLLALSTWAPLLGALLLAGIVTFIDDLDVIGFLIWLLGGWVIITTCISLATQTSGFKLAKLKSLRAGIWGMVVAHIGMGVTVIGIGMTSLYSEEADVRMGVGGQHEMQGYRFKLVAADRVRGPNYIADVTHFEVFYKDEFVAEIVPEKRRYLASGQIMTEAGIHANLHRDLYVAMGELLNNGDWAIRLRVKPFMRWVWLGGLLIALGGLLAMSDKRYRRAIKG